MLIGSDTVCSHQSPIDATSPAAIHPPQPDDPQRGRSTPIAWKITGHGGLGDQLVMEWRRLRRSPAAVSHMRALAVTPAPFDDLDTLLRLAGFGTPASGASDAVLARLVRCAAGDELAARVTLQRILPGLLAIARAERNGHDHATALADVVGEAWCAIRSYDAQRPATAVAARLLNDARHRAFTGPRRRRKPAMESRDLQQLAAPDDRHPFAELTTLLVDAHRAGLDEHMLTTVRLLLGHDSVTEAARAAGVTTRAVRYRRRALVDQVQSLLVSC